MGNYFLNIQVYRDGDDLREEIKIFLNPLDEHPLYVHDIITIFMDTIYKAFNSRVFGDVVYTFKVELRVLLSC